MYVPLHCYCSAPIGPTLVDTQLKHFVPDVNIYKIMGINVEKNKYGHQMEANECNDQYMNLHTNITFVHICANFELAVTKIVDCSTAYRQVLTS